MLEARPPLYQVTRADPHAGSWQPGLAKAEPHRGIVGPEAGGFDGCRSLDRIRQAAPRPSSLRHTESREKRERGQRAGPKPRTKLLGVARYDERP